jgi:hypothetical protein
MSDNAITADLARKAALFYARGKWGEVSLGLETPILGLEDETPQAYVFAVGIVSQELEPREVDAHLEKHIPELAEAYAAFARHQATSGSADSGRRFAAELVRTRRSVLARGRYGTIMIRARRNRHPAMLAYDGLPFTYVGARLALAIHQESLSLDPHHPIVYRLGEGDGYPQVFGEFGSSDGRAVLISLMDARSRVSKSPFPRRARSISPMMAGHYERIWALIEAISPAYLEAISPQYIASGIQGYIPHVPDLTWRRGCAPTAAGNVLAYWDTRGYSKLVDDPGKDEYDLIDELADAMDTDTSGSTKDGDVDDGIEAVCNDDDYHNNYDFDIDGPDGWYVWGKIRDAIDAGRPCHLIIHGHQTYHDHSVTVVGYRQVYKSCAADDRFVTIHDTWPSTGFDIEIPYQGSVDAYDASWQVTRINPGMKRVHTACSAAESAQIAARSDQRMLFRLLASPKTKGNLAKTFRRLYRNPILTEEFNRITAAYPDKLKQLGRSLNLAAYLAYLIDQPDFDPNLRFPAKTASEIADVLAVVRNEASPPLQKNLDLLIQGVRELSDMTLSEVRRQMLG